MVTGMISAKVILDSIGRSSKVRLTTMELEFPRCILAELNTHRVFSRNSASSRAIPISKMIERVQADPFIPKFAVNKPGMQSGELLEGAALENATEEWLYARDAAVYAAKILSDSGVHKQFANRLLEPFAWHTVIVTSTEWENFFAQRANPAAEPHMQELAHAMQTAYRASRPVDRTAHLPYMDKDEARLPAAGMISAARCARVSYLTHDGKRDIVEDYKLARRLLAADPMHASPFEHVAGDGHGTRNFKGWTQLRERVEADKVSFLHVLDTFIEQAETVPETNQGPFKMGYSLGTAGSCWICTKFDQSVSYDRLGLCNKCRDEVIGDAVGVTL